MSHPYGPQPRYIYHRARPHGVSPQAMGSYRGSFSQKDPWALPTYVAVEPTGFEGWLDDPLGTTQAAIDMALSTGTTAAKQAALNALGISSGVPSGGDPCYLVYYVQVLQSIGLAQQAGHITESQALAQINGLEALCGYAALEPAALAFKAKLLTEKQALALKAGQLKTMACVSAQAQIKAALDAGQISFDEANAQIA
ncbi:hypothetical protein KJ966_31625, partial [bacterium]|nr:hypothetical protein [bacterium]